MIAACKISQNFKHGENLPDAAAGYCSCGSNMEYELSLPDVVYYQNTGLGMGYTQQFQLSDWRQKL